MTGTLISRAWWVPTISIAGSSSSTSTLSEIFSANMCRPSNVGGVLYVDGEVHEPARSPGGRWRSPASWRTRRRDSGYVDGTAAVVPPGTGARGRSARDRLRLKPPLERTALLDHGPPRIRSSRARATPKQTPPARSWSRPNWSPGRRSRCSRATPSSSSTFGTTIRTRQRGSSPSRCAARSGTRSVSTAKDTRTARTRVFMDDPYRAPLRARENVN